MKIAKIELFRASSEITFKYHLSKIYGTLTHNDAVMVRITTEDGIEGWGEADPQPPFTEEWAGGVMALLGAQVAPKLIGEDAGNIAAAHGLFDRIAPGNPMARGAIDMALWDIAGKAAGVPVWRMLGGRVHEEIPVLWPIPSGTEEDSRAVIDAKMPEGYSCFMIKTGSRDVAQDAARTLALIAAYPDLSFIADANQGWSEAEALRYLALIGSAPLTLLEQPVARLEFEALARVRAKATMPVSADESVFSLSDAARLARDTCVDVFSIKLSKNGGILPARKIAELAEAHGMKILINSMIEFGVSQAAALQLGVTLPNLLEAGHAYMSAHRMVDDPTDFTTNVRDGVARVSERPGLGVSVDAAKLASITSEAVTIDGKGLRVGEAA